MAYALRYSRTLRHMPGAATPANATLGVEVGHVKYTKAGVVFWAVPKYSALSTALGANHLAAKQKSHNYCIMSELISRSVTEFCLLSDR